MRYQCGHEGCDVCGSRTCATMVDLRQVGNYKICEFCLRLAVKVAVNMAETFGGTFIDTAKPCGYTKRKDAASQSHGAAGEGDAV